MDEVTEIYKVDQKTTAVQRPITVIKPIKNIDFAKLRIPNYQRPYRWDTRNIKQLIDDIEIAKSGNYGNTKYRLGTLVLHQDNDRKGELDIVDGQQRIVSLSLILSICELSESDLQTGLSQFLKNEFNHPDSKRHIIENCIYIHKRRDEIKDLEEYITTQCEFVIVTLYKIDEAFQFFDSQNSRGKELSTSDKLKAYHLAEMEKELSDKDCQLIKAWESTNANERNEIFNALCRIKQWIKGERCWGLNDDLIEMFYGVKQECINKYPCYRLHQKYRESISEIFPFQILGEFVSGSEFFEMFTTYKELYGKIKNGKGISNEWENTPEYKVMYTVGYQGWGNPGDGYMRELFRALLLLYIDRFGEENIKEVACKIFREAYGIRINRGRIWWNAIEATAVRDSGLLKTIALASSPDDIIRYEAKGDNDLTRLPNSAEWTKIKENW